MLDPMDRLERAAKAISDALYEIDEAWNEIAEDADDREHTEEQLRRDYPFHVSVEDLHANVQAWYESLSNLRVKDQPKVFVAVSNDGDVRRLETTLMIPHDSLNAFRVARGDGMTVGVLMAGKEWRDAVAKAAQQCGLPYVRIGNSQ